MNNTNQPTIKTNPCFIGVDVLPRLKRREEHLRKQKQARRLYWLQQLSIVMFVIFGMFTALGVLGGMHMASLGLHSLTATFLFLGGGSAFLAFGAAISFRSVARKRFYVLAGACDNGDE